MKMYNKSKLTFVNGYLCKKDKVICINPDIVSQANELETNYQKAKYMAEQPKAQPMPTLDGFTRKSNRSFQGKWNAPTPTLDAEAQKAMQIMDEIDSIFAAKQLEEACEKYRDLLEFVINDTVIECCAYDLAFDTPVLGNPLEWTESDIVTALAYINGYDSHE